MKTKLIALIFLSLFLPAACYPVRYDGPYKGKVIDAETGNPLESVVVLGVWYKEMPTPAGAVGSYYDAMETVTDRNGEFEISGLGLRILSNVTPMNVLIFKAGYTYIGMGPWDSLNLDGGLLAKKVAWEGDRAIIPLRRVVMERKSPPSPPTESPLEKVKQYLKEMNKDRIERNLEPYQIWRGEKI